MWQVIRPWLTTHRNRIIGTGVVVVGWCALTYPTSSLLWPKLYYRLTPNTIVPVATNTEAMINEALMDLNMDRKDNPIDAKNLAIVQGQHPFPEFQHRGGIKTGGAFIVLTAGFEKSQLSRLLPKHIAKSLLLPEEVQRFAIARQILYAEDNFEMFKCILGVTCIIVYSLISLRIIKALNTQKATQMIQKTLRLGTASDPTYQMSQFLPVFIARTIVLGVPMLNLYWASLYGYSRNLERETDKTLASLNREYVISGKMFYEKALEVSKNKNRPLQYRKFQENGDLYTGLIHQKTLPFSARLKFFEDILEKEKQEKLQDEQALLQLTQEAEKQP